MPSDPEPLIHLRHVCPVCEGKKTEELPRGEFTASGAMTRRCRECNGAGLSEPQWVPISTVEQFLRR